MKTDRKVALQMSPMSIVIIIFLIWLGVLTFLYLKSSTNEDWKCTLVNCTSFITGEEWATDNCFIANNQEVCKLIIDGQNQLIPKQQLNISAIQQCTEYTCIEETKIRTTNYIINITS